MLKINRDLHIFALKNQIQTICEQFFASHGFSYFQYLRCYENGSIGFLSNETRAFELIATEVDNAPIIFSYFSSEHETLNQYYFFWNEALPDMPVSLVRERFQLHHGMTLVKRHPHYYDMIAVALPHDIEQPGSFYCTKLKSIEHFIDQFTYAHAPLIDAMDNQRLALPPAYRDVNYQKLCLPSTKTTVSTLNGLSYLTPQELVCLQLLSKGKTYKQIAKQLYISPRTVETYLNRIKQRTGAITRSDLQALQYHCP